MTIKVAINGYGRIGRNMLRAVYENGKRSEIEIVAVNEELNDSPELVNSDPYADGWIFKIKASDEAQVAALLDAAAYEALLEDE